ncbi:MAG: alpha-E domain-containing protein [Polymorphobacter sp.]
MLSRSAGSLYWVGRYLERAEYLSRLIEATLRLAALPSSYGGAGNAWDSALAAAWMKPLHAELARAGDEQGVSAFLTVDAENPSSIRSCLERARANARAVRTALTLEAWEAINSAWLDVQKFGTRLDNREDLIALLDTVKAAMLVFDGAAHRTMLRGDAYWFIQLGAAVERADNTARLLDVKYHLLLPHGEAVGGGLDYFQWTTILRTVSALTAYRWVYRTSVEPLLVADLLILNSQIPRSLASCYQEILRRLDQLAASSGRRGPAHRLASRGLAKLEGARIEDIFAGGLHEFLGGFIAANNDVGNAIAEQYLF